jgi:hypothetical protein
MKIARWLAWPVLCVSLMLGPVMAAEEPALDEPSSDDAPMDAQALGATLGYVAGAATAAPAPVVAGPTYVTVLPCSPNVVATGGVSYYGCGGSWYNQAYANGSVTYVIVSAPPGY